MNDEMVKGRRRSWRVKEEEVAVEEVKKMEDDREEVLEEYEVEDEHEEVVVVETDIKIRKVNFIKINNNNSSGGRGGGGDVKSRLLGFEVQSS